MRSCSGSKNINESYEAERESITYSKEGAVLQNKVEELKIAHSKAGEVSRDKNIWEKGGPSSHHAWKAKRKL